MGYIYKITNNINGKIYIGKTEFDIQKRFKEHIHDSKKRYCEQRPLYNAMNKYGVENFHIELIEETDNTEEKEKYWINYYNSYRNGYNATLGGEGRSFIDYNLIKEKFSQGLTLREIKTETGHDTKHLSRILKEKGITEEQIIEQSHKNQLKPLNMLDKKTLDIIKTFKSVSEASKYCVENNLSKDTVNGIGSHICQCCNGIRKTAYGYKWQYIN